MTDSQAAVREPTASRFTQQELSAVRPVLTPFRVILVYLLVGVILIPIGTVCLEADGKVKELKQRYDSLCLNGDTPEERARTLLDDAEPEINCTLGIRVEENMTAPVYVYYELADYFQNHRRYVKSRHDKQLAGNTESGSAACQPKRYQHSNNTKEDRDFPINPCGLTAWSYFNDTFQVERNRGEAIIMSDEGIAWKSDRQGLFGDFVAENFNNIPAFRGGGAISGPVSEDEHFIVWMRIASLPKFRKLYGIIHQDLLAGDDLTITIENRYNTYLFGGKKSVVLSTTSWQGGRNSFLGVVYLSMGCASVFVAVVFFILHLQFPRTEGDERFLSWKRKDY